MEQEVANLQGQAKRGRFDETYLIRLLSVFHNRPALGMSQQADDVQRTLLYVCARTLSYGSDLPNFLEYAVELLGIMDLLVHGADDFERRPAAVAIPGISAAMSAFPTNERVMLPGLRLCVALCKGLDDWVLSDEARKQVLADARIFAALAAFTSTARSSAAQAQQQLSPALVEELLGGLTVLLGLVVQRDKLAMQRAVHVSGVVNAYEDVVHCMEETPCSSSGVAAREEALTEPRRIISALRSRQASASRGSAWRGGWRRWLKTSDGGTSSNGMSRQSSVLSSGSGDNDNPSTRSADSAFTILQRSV